ncbi:MAG: hypothetical protein JKX85_09215, partial [Phycisphaeraceae bacterium]|nr:hypothetical protein [Phycisphaeraceae bacterium]
GSPGISKTSDHTDTSPQPENHNDPMSLENNPFPIPLQAKKSQVLKRFTALLVTDKSEDDPKDIETYHLKLTPKPNLGITFTQIDLWYDKATLLPIKCYTVNADSDDEQIFSLFNPKLNEPIDKKDMDTSAPTDRGWQIEVTPLKH